MCSKHGIGGSMMNLGEKLRQRRQELGLSQRQLCGEQITRNMLSQIENGSAMPSLETLQYLAAQLEKPVSFFLEECARVSENQDRMEQARTAYRAGDMQGVLNLLDGYRFPDDDFDEERKLLYLLALQKLAEQALDRGQRIYAGELLRRGDVILADSLYGEAVLRQQTMLQACAVSRTGTVQRENFPSLDQELLLRAEAAMESGDAARCAVLLEAVEAQHTARWNFLRGEAYFARQQYKMAAECYHRAEEDGDRRIPERLEVCYRELGDFRQAYEYACRRREKQATR